MGSLPTARADEFTELLSRRLPKKTYDHCVSVAEFMVSYSDAAGITEEQAVTAGLLHDLCKAMKGPALLDAVEKRGIEVPDLHRKKTTLLHGPVAAAECQNDLGVTDDDVYEAIFWHTTGRPNWNNVGLALYVADFSEPLRTIPEAVEARKRLEERGFGETVRYVTAQKQAYVARKFSLDPVTKAFGGWVESEFTP